ncbi:MAG TPA: ABC-2 family transporter protein [Kofleriaceae bacterium]|nr:ABC-2 family transporter protein [Kofleriaceae bacterium]
MRQYLRLVSVQLRTSVAQAMAYRADFLIQGVMSLAWLAVALIPLLIAFDKRPTVAGWDRNSALVMMAFFMAVKAVMEGVISPSITNLVENIRSGAFDYILLKPVDAQLMISASRYEPWRIFDLLGAIALATYAFIQIGHGPEPQHLAVGLALFVAGVFAVYAVWICCAAASFWVVRLDNLVYLLQAIFDIARWPVQVFSPVWRLVFTFVIPVAVMTTFPAMALLGRLSARTALATVGGSLLMLVISRLIWRSAIRNYTSASS